MISNSIKPKISYEMIVDGALKNIASTGGDAGDAMVIEAHFGKIGDWIDGVLHRCNSGICTIHDVALIKRHLSVAAA